MATTRPRILAISLKKPFLDEDQHLSDFLAALRSMADLQHVDDADSVMRLIFKHPRPSTVLLTDDALTMRRFVHVWDAVVYYMEQGGTCVCMGLFPSFVIQNNMKPFFAKAGLSWEYGLCQTAFVLLNGDAVSPDLARQLPPRYRLKALCVKNVRREDTWYYSIDEPGSADVLGQVAVALAPVGKGKLGYVGDVQRLQLADIAILAMCGLSGW